YNLNMTKRTSTKPIYVKDIQIGGQNRVVIQSMTNIPAKKINETIELVNDLADLGCELIRIAVLDEEDAHAFKHIIPKVKIPVIADIHYMHSLALIVIEHGVHKIRINPGNITNPEEVKKIITACKEKNIPIRIGVNSGSLPKDLMQKYGMTKEAMVEAALRHIEILEKENFTNIAVSVKSTDPILSIESYRELAKKIPYPLHLGITEAGPLIRGTTISAYALGRLIEDGLGDTIRVSLSDDPRKEVKVAKEILNIFELNKIPKLISCPTCGRVQYKNMFKVVNDLDKYLETLKGKVKIAVMGCAVNGLGEAQDADIAVVGNNQKGMIYVNKKIVKIVEEKNILKELKIIVNNYLKNKKDVL
ncbi:MAG: flavodoxin-dependent (E)-4-hydroxy-3-methylbut-2-enyl-diphosphate synthase, partial [Mycoplasma sp.]